MCSRNSSRSHRAGGIPSHPDIYQGAWRFGGHYIGVGLDPLQEGAHLVQELVSLLAALLGECTQVRSERFKIGI